MNALFNTVFGMRMNNKVNEHLVSGVKEISKERIQRMLKTLVAGGMSRAVAIKLIERTYLVKVR